MNYDFGFTGDGKHEGILSFFEVLEKLLGIALELGERTNVSEANHEKVMEFTVHYMLKAMSRNHDR